MGADIEALRDSAVEIARAGGAHTLNYFMKGIDVKRKEDDSPVTRADRETEQLIRKEIHDRYPSHGILGEEYEEQNPGAEIQWIIDPIDGTQSFIHGVPFYTTLIGVIVEDEPVVGVVNAPALDQLCVAAKDLGAYFNGKRCSVRSCSSLSIATFLSTDVTTSESFGFKKPFNHLLEHTKIHRTWGDAYGHMMVATGRADLMFDPVLNIWDAAPLLTVLREAGGVFCDVYGNQTIKTGNGISCSKELLPEVIEVFDAYDR